MALCCAFYVIFKKYHDLEIPVTFMCCMQTAENVVKLLSQPSSPIILIFYP